MAVRNSDYRFDLQLAAGLVTEAWFERMVGDDKFEVKHDRRAHETGRVYVELEDDPGRKGKWKPSGLATTQAECFIFVLGDPPHCFIGVTSDRLAYLVEQHREKAVTQPFGSCPTRGVCVPLPELLSDDDWTLAA